MRADARRNRDRLLAAAGELFAEQGRRLAGRGGPGPAWDRHALPPLPDARGAGRGRLPHEVDRLSDAADELLAEPPPDDALAAWMDLYVEYVAAKRGMTEVRRPVAAARTALYPETRGWHTAGRSRRLLAAGQADGTLRRERRCRRRPPRDRRDLDDRRAGVPPAGRPAARRRHGRPARGLSPPRVRVSTRSSIRVGYPRPRGTPRAMLPAWEPGTVAILSTGAGAPHAIPVSTAIARRPGTRSCSRSRRPARVARPPARGPALRAHRPAAGDVAFTAHGRATVLAGSTPRRPPCGSTSRRSRTTATARFEIDAGVAWHWTDADAARQDAAVRAALARLV